MNKPVCILDDLTLPAPARGGLQITPEKIWSQNAGRSTSTGNMVGDIITVKYHVILTFDRLDDVQFRDIWSIISGLQAFHDLTFPLADGASDRKKISCYFAPPTVKLWSWNAQEYRGFYDGLTIECIER